MKSITIAKKGATILHDAVLAHAPDGNPVFILPACVPAPQLDVHPKGMIVYSVPEQEFSRYVEQLLEAKEHFTFRVHAAAGDRAENPQSELRVHGLDLSAEQGKKTG